MAYDVILFDLDGTVIDSLDGIMHALEVCFAHAGLPPVTREQFLPFVGPPIILGRSPGGHGGVSQLLPSGRVERMRAL